MRSAAAFTGDARRVLVLRPPCASRATPRTGPRGDRVTSAGDAPSGGRLLVFGWQFASRAGKLAWTYRVVREDSGRDLVEFTLAVPGCSSELACCVLGLQLQITLNGIERTKPDELDAYLELAEA